MKKLTNLVVLIVLAVFSFPVVAQTPAAKKDEAKKVEVKKVAACPAGDLACVNRANGAVDEAQDLSILTLKKQVAGLKYAQKKLAEAKDLKSATDRIATLEEARKALPADLVGRDEIEKMIVAAESRSKAEVDKTIEALRVSLDARIATLETRMAELEGRVNAVEERIVDVEHQLKKRAVRLDSGGFFGTHSLGYEGGGAVWLLFPLGSDGNWSARIGGGMGGSDEDNLGWLAELDFLRRWGWFSIGPSLMVFGASDNRGNRDLMPAAGLALRADFAEDEDGKNWLFFQLMPFAGMAMEDPNKSKFGSGVGAEAGLHF